MNELFRLIVILLAGGVQVPGAPVARNILLGSAVNVIAVTCAAAAMVCWLVALWIIMLPVVGPAAAPFIIGALLAVVSAGALIAKRWRLGRPGTRVQSLPVPAQLLAEANLLYRSNRTSVLAAALMAGFLAARSGK